MRSVEHLCAGLSPDGSLPAMSLRVPLPRTPGGLRGRGMVAAFLSEPEAVQVLDCDSKANEVSYRDGLALVRCPAHCEQMKIKSELIGAGVHPMRSNVCMAAMVDKIMPFIGGELLISKEHNGFNGLRSYTGVDSGVAASISSEADLSSTWHAYGTASLDQPGAWPAEREGTCDTKFQELGLKRAGDSMVVKCPGNCTGVGSLEGTFIYTPRSSVCRAAEHERAVGSDGGRAVVTKRAGQQVYFTSKSATDASSDAGKTADAFTVALPLTRILRRVTKGTFL